MDSLNLVISDRATGGKVYIGNIVSRSESELKKNNITAIVNATDSIPKPNFEGEYCQFPLRDSLGPSDPLLMDIYLPSAVEVLARLIKNGHNVLVHCHAGMQRSATIVAGYLCKYYGFTPDESITYIVSKRPICFSYGLFPHFKSNLKKYYQNINYINIR